MTDRISKFLEATGDFFSISLRSRIPCCEVFFPSHETIDLFSAHETGNVGVLPIKNNDVIVKHSKKLKSLTASRSMLIAKNVRRRPSK